MNADRRNFIRQGLLAVGTAAAGTVAVRELAGQPAAAPSNGPITPSLTPDHQVVHHQCGKRVSLPVVNTTPRTGIPGRKFVMVFDLSKCDGCGKCTEACGKAHFIPAGRQWIKVLRMQDAEHTAPYFFPQP